MIDLQDLRTRPDTYKKAAKDKGVIVDIDAFLKLDDARKALLPNIEEMRAERNRVSKDVPTMKGDEKETALSAMKKLGEDLKRKEQELHAIEEKWQAMQLLLPALPLATVPVGKDASANVEVFRWGDIRAFDFEPRDHVALGEALGIIDLPRAAKVSGARSYFLKSDGARLHHAVLRFTIDHLLAKKKWELFVPPLLASYDCFMGTGFFPGVDQLNIYAAGGQESAGAPIVGDDLYLIGTSEVTVCSYHKDEIFEGGDLPKRSVGYSACFRREAGTYGKDAKGLYRVHQFEKVEQVVLCKADPEEALALFSEIRGNAEEVLQALKLPYRIVDVCTGDMGKGKVFMQDIETWMPSRSSYGETHSCSYLGDFQARRLNIRYRDGGETRYVHTLNNTCIASPRILIPILELYQNADGSVEVPEVLRPYMGGLERIAVL